MTRSTKTLVGFAAPAQPLPTSAERRRAQILAAQNETRELPFMLERRRTSFLPLISSGVYPIEPVTLPVRSSRSSWVAVLVVMAATAAIVWGVL